MRIYILLTCLTCFCCCSNKDKFRPELQYKIRELNNLKQLGYDNSSVISYLRDSCSRDELLKLMNQPSPIVRILAYPYKAIVSRKEEDLFTILTRHLSDTTKVIWWYYDDAVDEFTVSDLMIRKAENGLSRKQKDTLISMVLKDYMYLETAKWMMKEIDPQDKYYSIIKNQAKIISSNCHDLGFALAVAKFKKRNDVDFLKSRFGMLSDNPYCNDNIFKAIEIFPDSSFFPILQHYFNNGIRKRKQSSYDDLELYCRAVAQYKNSQSLAILEALTEQKTYPDDWYLPRNKEYVFKAVRKYSSSIYKNLYGRLKLEMSKNVISNSNRSFKDEPQTW